jgi:photosystem II stability/assembly factor-like uncharacterized protein
LLGPFSLCASPSSPRAADRASPFRSWPGLLLLLLLTACTARPPQPVWEPLGRDLPAVQPVLAIAVAATDPALWLVATDEPPRLYRSLDGGVSWERLEEGWETRRVYTLLAVPGREGVFLAGTSDGLFRSEDAGRTWTAIPDVPRPVLLPSGWFWPGRQVYSLVAAKEGTLYLGGAGAQPWQSTDAGRTWHPLAPLPAGTAILALALTADGRLLAGSDGAGLFRSDDGGQSWHRVTALPATYVAGLWPDPDDEGLVYARTRAGLYRSEDGGETWVRTAVSLSGRLDVLLPGPQRGQALVFANDGRVYSSTDGGQRWAWRGTLNRRGVVLTARRHPADGSILLGHQTGLWQSRDEGRTWRLWPTAPGLPRLYDLIQTADGILYLATSAGLYRSHDGGSHWEPVADGLPTATALAIAAAPADATILYAGFEGHGLYRSTDGGRTWTATALDVPDPVGILVDPTAARHVWVRAAFQRIYESRDGGAHWTTPWEGLDLSTELITLAWIPTAPPTLFAAGTERLHRRREGDERWQPVAPLMDGQTVFSLVADPDNPRQLYAGATRGVYRSTDAGLSWEPWGRGLETITVTGLLVLPERPRVLLAGTKYHGLFRSDDGGRTWRAAGLEGRSIIRLLMTPDGRRLLAATDEGLWRTTWEAGR